MPNQERFRRHTLARSRTSDDHDVVIRSTPDGEVRRRSGERVDPEERLPLIRKRRAKSWNQACGDELDVS